MLTGLELVYALLIITAGAAVLGSVSFGLGMVAVPVLLLFIDPKATVVIVNCFIGVVLAFVLLQTWRHLDLRSSGGMVLGGVVATPVGVLALNIADPGLLKIIIAVVILVLGLLSFKDLRLPVQGVWLAGPVFGFVTSLAVTAIAIGGPLAAVYAISERWPPQTVRASLALMFFLAAAAAMAQFGATGLLDRDTLANIGLLLPGVLVGVGIGYLLAGRLNEQAFRYVVIVLVLTGGTVLLVRELAF